MAQQCRPPRPLLFLSSSSRTVTRWLQHGVAAHAPQRPAVSPQPPAPPSFLQLLPPPPSDLVEAADSGGIPKAAARRTGRPADRGWGFIGRRLGFGARERAAGIRFRGAWRPSGGASAAGKGRRPWGRRGSPPAPRPHGVRHGENNREIRIRPDRLGPHVSGCGVWLW
jgi:hypothetical protein